MPFVIRLPGTSDSPWIEAERAAFIVIETARRIVAAEYDGIGTSRRSPRNAAWCVLFSRFHQ